MIPHSRKYHVITVHYGDDTVTKKLVEQLLRIPEGPDHVVVIDHAKQPLALPASPAHLEVIRPSRNSGYAGGVNTGLGLLAARAAAPNDIVVVMNNDLSLTPDAFQTLRRWWQEHPALAVAGAQLQALNLFTGRAQLSAKPSPSFWQRSYLDGALLSAPLQVFMYLQGLPNHLFLYWEDVVFSLRARQVGLPLHVIPGLSVAHHTDKSHAAAADQLYYLVRNGALVLSRATPYPWRLMWRVANAVRRVYHALRPATPASHTIRSALRDASHNRTGKRP